MAATKNGAKVLFHGILQSVGIGVDIVAIENGNPIQPHPLKRGLDRTHHTVITVDVELAAAGSVEPLSDSGPVFHAALVQKLPHLGRDDYYIARLAAEKAFQAVLRQTQTVKRRNVEIAKTFLPGQFQDAPGVLYVDGPIEIGHGCCSKANLRQGDTAVANAIEMARFQSWPPCPSDRSLAMRWLVPGCNTSNIPLIPQYAGLWTLCKRPLGAG